jgi:hypothetical protein
MYRLVVCWKSTDFSEQSLALPSTCFMQVSSLVWGRDIFLRNVCWFSTSCTALHPRR